MRLSLFLFVFWVSISACKPNNERDPKEIDDPIGTIVFLSFRLSEATKPILDTLASTAVASGNPRLKSYSFFINSAWQLYFPTLSAKAKQNLNGQLDSLAEHTPYPDLQAHIVFWKGVTSLLYLKLPDSVGLSLILQGKSLLEENHYERLPYAAEYYARIADMYHYFGDNKAAILYTQKALAEPPTQWLGRQTLYNNLGAYFLQLKEYDQADAAWQKAIIASDQLGMEHFAILVQANRGNLLRVQGKYKEALPLLYPHAVLNEDRYPEDVALARLYIASCLLHLDSVNKAREWLRPAPFPMPHWSQPTYDLTTYEVQGLYNSKAGNLTEALTNQEALMHLKDSIYPVRDAKVITVMEGSLKAERFAAERKRLLEGRRWRNIGIVVLLVGAAAIIFLLVLRHRAEKNSVMEQRLRAEQALRYANEQLNAYLKSILEKNKLIEEFRQQLLTATASNTLTPDEKEAYLRDMQASVLLTGADWDRFRELFEKVFPGFFAMLLQQYPDLSPAEIRLLALDKLNLTDKEKGAMLHITPDAIKKGRYRLRKKYPDLLS